MLCLKGTLSAARMLDFALDLQLAHQMKEQVLSRVHAVRVTHWVELVERIFVLGGDHYLLVLLVYDKYGYPRPLETAMTPFHLLGKTN